MASPFAALAAIAAPPPTAPLAPLFANTTSLQAAVARGSFGVGYGGCGFLLFYYIGVSKVLQQLGVIKPGSTKIAATSAGMLTAGVDLGFVSHEKFLRLGKDLATGCSKQNSCAGSLDAAVVRAVQLLLPPDAAKIANGTAFFTHATPDDATGVPLAGFVSSYASNDDLADTIRSGAWIPVWSGPSMTRPFRGGRAMDGGFARQYPCPEGVSYCLTVAVVPPIDWVDLTARLLAEPESLKAIAGATGSTLGTEPKKFVDNVLLPLRGLNLTTEEVIGGVVAYLRGVSPSKEVSIWPGKYAKLPCSAWEWIVKVLMPPSAEEVDSIVALGAADATGWAREQGLLPALPAPVPAAPSSSPRRAAA
ncbi:hypothetical protein Rsub_04770 [Raphidocelis subcapitata]|uniref:PNPLA domain-containing protein n=1 Tax=Raphidocelis subcapitata TaxID=307507 RepID=A0A2V0NTY4_9CHLO|nr:hypothetical protein Rsub_04770 [Raphidocelis subcapitata]|eukprot:GBF91101.1 hypothetical protein Rsub_04770 [Raphidocelis subcapitata]